MQSYIETRSLIIGCIANLAMACAGWIAFHFSHSEALLLDGNFSFVLFLTGLLAVGIALVKKHNSNAALLDGIYTVTKSLLIMFVLSTAVVSNIVKIFDYLSGKPVAPLIPGVIGYYIVAVVTICFSLAAFYRYQNRKIANSSRLLATESTASLIDGIMSSGAGAALLLVCLIPPTSTLSFMLYIGDAIAVLLLSVCMIKQPILMISEVVNEALTGNTLETSS